MGVTSRQAERLATSPPSFYMTGPGVQCASVYTNLSSGLTRVTCKPNDVVRNLDTQSEWSGYCVNWRYVTRDHKWLMVRDTRDIHYGGWVFMPLKSFDSDRSKWHSYYEGTCP